MSDPMRNDIISQPEFLKKLIKQYVKDEFFSNELKKAATYLKESKGPILFIGMGSSHFAAIPAVNRLCVNRKFAFNPPTDELLHYQLPAIDETFTIVAVSQSGESIETKKVVEKIKDKCRVIAITNNPQSTIAKLADVNLPIFAGKEATISTKTFTNTLLLLDMLVDSIFSESVDGYRNLINDFDVLAAEIDVLLSQSPSLYDELAEFKKLTFIARGNSLAAAKMGGLICKEGTGLQPAAISGGAFRHGPLEIAGPDHAAIILADTKDKTFDLMLKLAKELFDFGSKVIFVTDQINKDNYSFNYIKLNKYQHLNTLFPFSIVIQILTREIALRQGRIPGKLNKISKVTRVE
ncbi:SIS domain-containing protein [Halocella sp. SP3-1]|uniref:SIS domain-containing protein n=1 Tax=Halocella sp. SP3-1 TaxID=2382161 RepID=UPI000F75D653|nr:SIS domain-containing protein [Halocella sp. SP3-1]AZO93452.1 SIS domain-containing protein [Halocella sp. SP3-1]